MKQLVKDRRPFCCGVVCYWGAGWEKGRKKLRKRVQLEHESIVTSIDRLVTAAQRVDTDFN